MLRLDKYICLVTINCIVYHPCSCCSTIDRRRVQFLNFEANKELASVACCARATGGRRPWYLLRQMCNGTLRDVTEFRIMYAVMRPWFWKQVKAFENELTKWVLNTLQMLICSVNFIHCCRFFFVSFMNITN